MSVSCFGSSAPPAGAAKLERWAYRRRLNASVDIERSLRAGSSLPRGAVTESRFALACRHLSAVATVRDQNSSPKDHASALVPNRRPQPKERIAEKVQAEIERPRRTQRLRTSKSGHPRTARAIARGREPWIRRLGELDTVRNMRNARHYPAFAPLPA